MMTISRKNSNPSYFVPRHIVPSYFVLAAILSTSYNVHLLFCPQAIMSSSHYVRRYTVRRHCGSRDFVRTPAKAAKVASFDKPKWGLNTQCQSLKLKNFFCSSYFMWNQFWYFHACNIWLFCREEIYQKNHRF